MAGMNIEGEVLFVAASLIFLVVLVAPCEAGGCGCPPLWTAFQDHCYRYFVTKNITWINAEMTCRDFSVPCGADSSDRSTRMGHLTSVHSQEEMDFLTAMYASLRSKRVTTRVWIGLHDKGTESTHEWVDGSSLNYTNWGQNQPNDPNGNSDCTVFEHWMEFGWNDFPCNTQTLVESFICKLPKW